jgi:O-Antigen ligase
MTSVAWPRRTALTRASGVGVDGSAIALWLIPFALTFYLGMRGGGYDELVRGTAGVVVWWIVLVGAAFALLPTLSFGRVGWLAIALLGAFVTWTGLSSGWSLSPGRSAEDLAKVATYLSFFVLALTLQRGERRSHVVNGAATAVALISILAVLSRLRPDWFPGLEYSGTYLDPIRLRRLAYPLNYWNGLAALVTMGIPLVLHVATSARGRAARAVGVVVIPIMVLCVFFTASRGIVLWLPAGILAYLVLAPSRRWRAAWLLLTALGSGLLVAAAEQRDALQSGVVDPVSRAEGDSLLTMILLVCAGTALIGLALAAVEERRAVLTTTRAAASPAQRNTRVGAVVAAAAVVVAGLVSIGAPGDVQSQWHDFKQPVVPSAIDSQTSAFSRLQSASGNGRYQFWQGAADQQHSDPLRGTGSDTFELWWAQHSTTPTSFVRDTHSLYLQTYGELGWIGLGLLGGWLLLVIGAGAFGALRAPRAEDRGLYAAATAACVAFVVSAAFEWTWQIAVIPALLMLMAGVALAKRDANEPSPPPRIRNRLGVVAIAVACLAVSVLPLMGAKAVRDSTTLAANGDLRGSLARATDATRLQPDAAAPRLQQALVLERLGDLRGAERDALAAIANEPTGWRNYVVLSRLRARLGDAEGAVRAYRHARSLNPNSATFRNAQ